MAKSERDKEIERYARRGLLASMAKGKTKCPMCGIQYATETLLRYHLTRSMCASRVLGSKRTRRK